jgi:hypothetical protein
MSKEEFRMILTPAHMDAILNNRPLTDEEVEANRIFYESLPPEVIAECLDDDEMLPHVPSEPSGGHAIARHVDKSIAFLKKNLTPGITAFSSTFQDIETAERALKEAVHIKRNKILWRYKTSAISKKKNYAFEVPLGRVVGWGISSAAPDEIIEMSRVRVVLSFVDFNHLPYFVLTMYPVI